jgi:anti-anti-sigma factor
MPDRGPSAFYVEITPGGSLMLRGELDLATVQDLQEKVDEIMVPGQPVVMDLAQLTFLDSSAIHLFIRTCATSGHPVVLRDASSKVRRILYLADGKLQPDAWVFEPDGHDPNVV